jgi:hypothetical protein
MQPFYLLDPREAVQDLFLLPDFVAARGTARTHDKIGTWEASQAYKDLDDRLKETYGPSKDFPDKGPLYSRDNSAYDLGMDGVQMMVSKQFNTILCYLR